MVMFIPMHLGTCYPTEVSDFITGFVWSPWQLEVSCFFCCIFGENSSRITIRLINDSAVSYLDCFRLISTLLQDLVDPWRANTQQRGEEGRLHKQTPSGNDDHDVTELQSDTTY